MPPQSPKSLDPAKLNQLDVESPKSDPLDITPLNLTSPAPLRTPPLLAILNPPNQSNMTSLIPSLKPPNFKALTIKPLSLKAMSLNPKSLNPNPLNLNPLNLNPLGPNPLNPNPLNPDPLNPRSPNPIHPLRMSSLAQETLLARSSLQPEFQARV
jgi:hypothetical protein